MINAGLFACGASSICDAPARRPAVDWAMAGWFQFAADCLALLILAIAVASLVGIVVAALRDR
jgi:hypothetical protein